MIDVDAEQVSPDSAGYQQAQQCNVLYGIFVYGIHFLLHIKLRPVHKYVREIASK